MTPVPTRALYDMLRGPSPAVHIAPDVSREAVQTHYPEATIVVNEALAPGTIRECRFTPKT